MAERLNVKINGLMGSPATERWSIGVNYGGSTGGDFGNPVFLSNLAVAFASYLQSNAAVDPAVAEMGSVVTITDVDIYGYNSAGPADASASAALTVPKVGVGTTRMPFQAARVVSLLTGLPGARRRGRIYVPATGATVAATGKTPILSGYTTAWVNIFKQVETLWGGTAPIELGVYSAVDDQITPVTALRTGDVMDTQRRRRDSIPEQYTTVTY